MPHRFVSTVVAPLILLVSFIVQANQTAVISPQGYTRIHNAPDTRSRALALIKQNDTITVLMLTDTWVRAQFATVEGWIERKNIALAAETVSAVQSDSVFSATSAQIPAPTDTGYQSSSEPSLDDKPALESAVQQITRPRPPQEGFWSRVTRKITEVTTEEPPGEPISYPPGHVGPTISEFRQQDTLFARIIAPSTPVRAELDPRSHVVTMAQRGKIYRLDAVGTSWVKVAANNTSGWVERAHIEIIDPRNRAAVVSFPTVFLIACVTIATLAITGILFLTFRKKQYRPRRRNAKTVLLIARSTKILTLALTNKTISIASCFSEVGFQVLTATDVTDLQKRIIHSVPAVLVVDWQLSPAIASELENVLSSRASMTSIPVLYYNVPDPVTAIRRPTPLAHAYYLGPKISDRDIFGIVTPLIITGKHPHTIKKSVQNSALEGQISEGNLSTVLQLIEIGNKTGCLLVQMQRPYGMIYFENGLITYAAAKEATAAPAVYAILGLSSGLFRFVSAKRPHRSNCRLRVMELLMEWARTSDESNRS